MLEATRPASASESPTSAVFPGGEPSGTGPTSTVGATGPVSTTGGRSSRKKRGLLRRTGILVPAVGLALLLVVVTWGAAKVMSSNGGGASSLFQSIDSLGQSGSVAALEQERQTIIAMGDAAKTLTVVAKPASADPQQILAAENASSSSSSSSSSSGSSSGGGTPIVSAPPPNPGTAQAIGYQELAAFGYSQSTQWGCLLDLWNRESGWVYDAENTASGAYGIPQALPGYKMSSAGADWQTNPRTQIIWGLGYIKSIYGTPCGAWDHEEADGYY
jgi:hypothetical protein